MAGEVQQRSAVDIFVQYVQDRAQVEASIAGQELADTQLEEILSAVSEDDLFTALNIQGITALKDLAEGTEVQINAYHLVRGNRDEFSNRLGVFAVIQAQLLADGTNLTLDTGVERVIGFLRMVESGKTGQEFPVQVRIHKITTGSGNVMVTFQKVPRRAVKS